MRVEEVERRALRVVGVALLVEARLVPDVEHRRWGDDVSERGRRGGGLVGVDRVGVADDVAPVPDHRLVDRVAGDVERRAPPDQPPQRVEVEAPGRRVGRRVRS